MAAGGGAALDGGDLGVDSLAGTESSVLELLRSRSVKELRHAASVMRVSTAGGKQTLIQRIHDAMQENGAT